MWARLQGYGAAVRRGVGLALVVGALGTAFALYSAQRSIDYVPILPLTSVAPLTTMEENSVAVELVLERDAHGTLVIAATYAPQSPDLHLYSTDLPRTGIDGAGRPTLLELPPQRGIHAIGGSSADQPVRLQSYDGFSAPFPIYPEGAVTLRLPVVLDTPGPVKAEFVISYMACSRQGYCLPPVADRHLIVVLAP